MTQITTRHLDFVQKAKEAFDSDPTMYTFRDGTNDYNDSLIALRYGMDRDCILVYELGERVANFVQQIKPNPYPRKTVIEFAFDMEAQLKVNDHKGGWESSTYEFLENKLDRQIYELWKELSKPDKDKHEITIRCANIANYAMMIADNEGEHL